MSFKNQNFTHTIGAATQVARFLHQLPADHHYLQISPNGKQAHSVSACRPNYDVHGFQCPFDDHASGSALLSLAGCHTHEK